MDSPETTVSLKTIRGCFALVFFTASRLQRIFPALVLVFEYDEFSGEAPVNLFIEENLLQHVPRPRTRVGLRSFHPRTTGSVQSFKKSSQSKLPKEPELILETHNENISDGETKSSDVSADTSVMGSVTVGPTSAVHTKAMSQASQSGGAGRDTRWPVPVTAEPADDSPSVSPKEATQPSHNIRVTAEYLLLNGMETSSLELKDQTQTIDDSSAANPNTVPLNPTTDASPTSRPSSAPVQPTFITDATTPQDETSPTHASSSTLPSVTSTLTVLTSTSAEAASNAKLVAQVKQKHRISWKEEKVEDELLNMSEPMQRLEESTSEKPGKYVNIYGIFTVVLESL